MAVDPRQAEQVSRIFSTIAGGGQPAAAGAVPGGQPPQAPPVETKTDTEKATDKGAPQTEEGQRNQPPAIFKVKMDDGSEREYTESQIKGMASRYAALNDKHATFSPVMQLVERLT